MSSARRSACIGAAVATTLTLVTLVLLDILVQQQLGGALAGAALSTRAGPGAIALDGLEVGSAARVAVDLAQDRAAMTWQYGGTLVVGLGTAAVLLNGVAGRLAGWIEARLPEPAGRGLRAR